MNHLSVEEVAERRAQLKKMRELMFRVELKAKRVSKIKSKTYRRIQRKEKEKMAAKLDGDAEDEDEDATRLKREVERARERATLKHKNTGKWAKAMKERGELDEDQRHDINEMLERGERLRKKIRGEDSEDDSDDDDSEGEDVEGLDGVMKIKSNAFEELSRVKAGDSMPGPDSSSKGKGIFEMKFMKEAAARQSREVDQTVDDFRKEMGEMNVGSDSEEEQTDEAMAVPVQRNGGRVMYGPGAQVSSHRH